MKVALLTDTHWGVRSDNVFFLDNIKKFLDSVFFPYIDKHKIKHIVHLGDIVDRRKYINFNVAKRLRNDFLEPLQKRKATFDVIVGNHDIFYKQTTNVNSAHELLYGYPFNVYTTAKEVQLGNTSVLYVPWICDENKEQSLKLITKTKAQVVFGHLELVGFEMFKGVYNEHGQNRNIYDRFDLVCSGHFHHRSSVGNIHYLGASGQFTWSDFGDDRGFHIFDSNTRKLTFIKNPYNVFEKVFYNDSQRTKKEVLSENFKILKDKYVKVIVQAKTNVKLFDTYMGLVDQHQPVDVRIIDDHLNQSLIDDGTIAAEAKDTLTIFREYVKQADSIVDSEKLDALIVGLYTEAQKYE